MIRLSVLTCLVFLLSACAGIRSQEESVKDIEQRTFAYNYQVPNVGQEELWRRARGYFADALDETHSEFQVQDQDAGTLTGRGLATWFISREHCSAEYHIRFQSQNEKARLKLQLIEDVPPFTDCSGWGWPGKDAEDAIVSHFESLSEGLGAALDGN